ncbi:acyl-homoserine-lactone acylase [Tamaricihabitans halophyticus]|uniref:Acyl-homoserine-lactone acylase n=1 Tax=Tamaricihabitans halophyticus TaxID=1262583 RepID=A0A4R2QH49_9PSEU|nr:penicillin acylase family protein [Tamaricihabitans halophyticus]TCP48582.1 acyl-homoserine-lactone acylase [Tamaricihabitans halophyticus]
MRHRRYGHATRLLIIGFACALLPLVAPSATAESADAGEARSTIRYTEYGVPHIRANNYRDLGYGYGYAAATDNICEIANGYLTVSAERSRFLGADQPADPALGSASTNLDSDLHFKQINDSGIVERLAQRPAPLGPRTEVRQLLDGYTRGYNRYLAERGPDGITDPTCRGAEWLRPITVTDVYRHFYAIATISGQGLVVDGISRAQPPSAGTSPAEQPTAQRLGAALRTPDMGSNGIAIGSAGTTGKERSVLLGNPHYPWQGGRRFWQAQLTIPGELNVAGGSLLGLPLIQIGHTNGVAWTHTVATPRTFGLYEVQLAQDDPTSYLVDGKPKRMTSRTVTVQAKQPDGSVRPVSRTLYSTEYGPVVTSGAGVPLPWTAESAYAIRDANMTNMRGLNTWFEFNRAQSTADLHHALRETQGVPWVNTIASDNEGTALYSDIQVVPHVTDELAKRCGTPLGQQLFPDTGLSVLDGSRSGCAWGSDPDAIEPGLFGPDALPSQQRDDYVLNSNDSAWLTNATEPITDYPRVVGDKYTERSPRTREALRTVTERLAGTDGRPGKGFDRESMQRMLFANRSSVAELAAADTARMCASFPDGQAPSAAGPVPVAEGCAALAGWGHDYRLDARGALLFERFVLALEDFSVSPWRVPFDPNDPLGTPNTLRTDHPEVRAAFGNAAAELRSAGIALDAPLGENQFVERGERRIPVHGAPEELGVLNMLVPTWDPERGNTEVVHGSSYIQSVAFTGDRCPDVSTLLTYSQSSDPSSPHFADQTELFSASKWVAGRFCERDIRSSPDLRVLRLD